MTTEPGGNKDRDAASPSAIADTPGVRILKFVVVGMAVLIVAGLGAVMWKLFDLAGPRSTGVVSVKPSIVDVKPMLTAETALSPEFELALPKGSNIRSLSLDGNRLAVHYERVQGAEIAILDLESGKVLSRVNLLIAP